MQIELGGDAQIYRGAADEVTITDDDFKIEGTGGGAGSWYNSGTGWTNRKKITFDEAMVPGSTNFSNFPVLVHIASDTDLAADAQADGDDILFTGSDKVTKLDHEIEYFNSSTGELIAWVEVPTLFATANTDIYLYYANGSATNQQNVEGTWNSDFKLVQHFEETTIGGTDFIDSTTNNNDSTSALLETGAANQAGQIGSAVEFDGTDDYIGFTTNSSVAADSFATSGMTFSVWANLDGAGGSSSGRFLGKQSGNSGYDFRISAISGANMDATGNYQYNTATDANSITTGYPYTTNTWQYYTFVYEGDTTDIVDIYLNGAAVSLASQVAGADTVTADTTNYRIGNAIWTTARGIDGHLDEARVVGTVRSSDWLTAEYNNQVDANDQSVGTEEIYSAGGTGPVFLVDSSEGSLNLGTTSQPGTPSAGDIYSSGSDLYFYNGSGWDDLTAAAGGGSSEWTDGGTYVYPADGAAESAIIGGTTLATADILLGAGGDAVFNDQGLAAGDFRVEGDTDANLLFVDASTDRIGIGTSTPAAFLHIKASTTAAASLRLATGATPTAPAAGDIYSDGTNIYFYNGSGWDDLTSGGGTSEWTDAGTYLYPADGATENVGIGLTTSPFVKLQVAGTQILGNAFTATASNDANVLNLLVGSSAVGTANGISFFEDDTGFAMHLGYNGTGTGDDNKLAIYDDTGTEIIAFENGGNVGIGVTNPAEALEVNGAIKIGTTTNTTLGNIRWTGADFEGYTGSGWTSLTASGGGGGLWTDGGTVSYLTAIGDDVAVGGTTLASPFSVDVDTNIVRIGDGVNDANDPTLTFYTSTGAGSSSISLTDGSDFYFSNSSVLIGAAAETLSNAGFVVGANDLFVDGDAGIDGNIYTDGSLIFASGITITDTTISQSTSANGDLILETTGGVNGDIRLEAQQEIVLSSNGDGDDYIYLNTASNNVGQYWEGYTTNDPAVRVNATTNELEYRDENETGWTSFDSLSTGGSSLWNDGGTTTYLIATADDLAVGGTGLASPFSIDVSLNTVRIGDGVSDTNDPTINFFASDGVDSGSLSYLDADNFYFSGGAVLIGASGETLSNGGFSVGTDDLFVAGTAGIEGNVYTDGSFIAGSTLTVSDGSITQSTSGTGNLTISTTGGTNGILSVDANGPLRLFSNGDPDDYFYLDVSSNNAGLYWEGYTTNDPAIRVNSSTNEIEYRDENETAWTSLDSLAGGGSTLWTDGGTTTYLTATGDDFAVGGTGLTSPFSVDVSANSVRIGDGTSDTNDPTITFYASDAVDSGTLSYLDADNFAFQGGSVLIGATAETIGHAGFSLGTNDLFVAGDAGFEGGVYTDTGVYIGSGTYNVIGTSAAAGAASSTLYWGSDKVCLEGGGCDGVGAIKQVRDGDNSGALLTNQIIVTGTGNLPQVSATALGSCTQSQNITFNYGITFDTIPNVVSSPEIDSQWTAPSNSIARFTTGIGSITTTGFNYGRNVTANGSDTQNNTCLLRSIDFDWVAIGEYTGTDLAENFVTTDLDLEPGEIVAIDPELDIAVKKSDGSSDDSIFGIVSTRPGQVLGGKVGQTGDDDTQTSQIDYLRNSELINDEEAKMVQIALAGRVPVKVSLENGIIKKGDYLTASSTPGVAMKAIKPGLIIGRAMEDFDGTQKVFDWSDEEYLSLKAKIDAGEDFDWTKETELIDKEYVGKVIVLVEKGYFEGEGGYAVSTRVNSLENLVVLMAGGIGLVAAAFIWQKRETLGNIRIKVAG